MEWLKSKGTKLLEKEKDAPNLHLNLFEVNDADIQERFM